MKSALNALTHPSVAGVRKAGLVFVLLSAIAGSSPALDAPEVQGPILTFAAETETVTLDVFVTRDGEPVTGLRAGDFVVKDEGRRVDAELVPTKAVPLAALLVLDTSASVTGGRLDSLLQACQAFVAGLGPDDQVQLVTFASTVSLRSALTADRQQIGEALGSVKAGERTALFDALYASLLMARSAPGRPVVLLFSDGDDTVSWLGPNAALDLARETSTLVYAVGTTSQVLRDIASSTGGRFIGSMEGEIKPAFLRVLHELRTRYLLRLNLEAPKSGWHQLEVSVPSGKGTVRCRPGYQRDAPPAGRSSTR